MIGNRETIEPFSPCRLDELLRAANTIAREKRVTVKVDLNGHEASLSKPEKGGV
jgi:hypothetical protein